MSDILTHALESVLINLASFRHYICKSQTSCNKMHLLESCLRKLVLTVWNRIKHKSDEYEMFITNINDLSVADTTMSTNLTIVMYTMIYQQSCAHDVTYFA